MHTVYVDNLIVVSHTAETVTAAVGGAKAALNSRGLLTHEEEGGSFDYRALGVSIGGDPALTRLTKKKWWLLYRGLGELIRFRHASSKMIEVVVGHVTVACLLRREMLSVLRACYDFISRGYTGKSKL